MTQYLNLMRYTATLRSTSSCQTRMLILEIACSRFKDKENSNLCVRTELVFSLYALEVVWLSSESQPSGEYDKHFGSVNKRQTMHANARPSSSFKLSIRSLTGFSQLLCLPQIKLLKDWKFRSRMFVAHLRCWIAHRHQQGG